MSRTLTSSQLVRAKAVKTAVGAYTEGSLPWCGGQFNTVVLDDPDGSGFLVYLLRPIPGRGLIPVGGHYRITVSADGAAAERIDQLFASCLTIDPKDGVPEGTKIVAATMSHIVSPTPLETHVFLSLQEKLPFYVITGDSRIWHIEQGAITLVNANSEEKASGAGPADP